MRNIEVKFNSPFSQTEIESFARFLGSMYGVDNIILHRVYEDGEFTQLIRNEK